MNEIYKKLTTIKLIEIQISIEKMKFSFWKVNFSLLEKKILKKVDFFLLSFIWTFRTSGT